MNLISDRDTAVRGVLWRQRGAWLILRDAAIIRGATAPVTMDGEVVVHRANVAFVQVLPDAGGQ